MGIISLIIGIISVICSFILKINLIFCGVALVIVILSLIINTKKQLVLKIISCVLLVIAVVISLITNLNNKVNDEIIDITKTTLHEDMLNTLNQSINLRRAMLLQQGASVEQAQKEYTEILKNDYKKLYEEGYRIKVYSDHSYKIIEP